MGHSGRRSGVYAAMIWTCDCLGSLTEFSVGVDVRCAVIVLGRGRDVALFNCSCGNIG